MHTRQTQRRVEWRVRVRTAFGNVITEYRLTEDKAREYAATRPEGFVVLDVVEVERLLDY